MSTSPDSIVSTLGGDESESVKVTPGRFEGVSSETAAIGTFAYVKGDGERHEMFRVSMSKDEGTTFSADIPSTPETRQAMAILLNTAAVGMLQLVRAIVAADGPEEAGEEEGEDNVNP